MQKAGAVVDALGLDIIAGKEGYTDPGCQPRITMGQLPSKEGDSVVVLELFGGLCGGAAAALAAGLCVEEVFYCDADEVAAAAAAHHWTLLVAAYPEQVGLRARRLNRELPQDVTKIKAKHLVAQGLHSCKRLLLFAGWPCQGRSVAGLQRGIRDERSSLAVDLHRLMGQIDALRLGQPGAKQMTYVLENAAVGPTVSEDVRLDQQRACQLFGKPLILDGAQFDGYSHRERCIWTNIGRLSSLAAALQRWRRDPALRAQDVLQPGRTVAKSPVTDGRGAGARYPCNVTGAELRAWPTLMASAGSYAFVGEREGVVLDHNVQNARGEPLATEPNATERERILGYLPDATAAAGVTETQRCSLLGNSFCQNMLVAVLATARGLRARHKQLVYARRAEAEERLAAEEAEKEPPMTDEDARIILNRLETLIPRLHELWLAEAAVPVSDDEVPATSTSAGGGEVGEGQPEKISAEADRRVPLDYKWDIGEADLPAECRRKMEELLRSKDKAFGMSKKQLGCMKHKEFEVGVKDDVESIWTHRRRLPEAHEAELLRVVAELQSLGIIVEAPDDCRFAAPTVMAPKRDHLGNITLLRMCVDYRAVNEHTPPDRYPMPLMEDLVVKAGKWTLFSTGDLIAGFHQVRVAEKDQPKTAFHGPRSLMMYKRAPFGLKRMPNWFQREMEYILEGSALVFVDDLLTGSTIKEDYSNFDDHIAAVGKMLDQLIKYGLTLNPDKCHWAKRKVKFLGHWLTPGHVEMEESKVEAMLAVPRPKNVAELQSWVHLVGYYSKLIDNFSARAEPLRRLLKKGVAFEWGDEQQKSWLDLRDALTQRPVLAVPDGNLPFVLSTDWSANGLSAILSQIGEDGLERVVAYASRSCSKSERSYASYKGEMLAAVWGVDHYQYWLTGRRFKLVTDHQPLAFLMKSQKLTGIYFRWAMRLSEYDLEIVYRPGTANVADLHSRYPLPQETGDWENFKSDVDYFSAERPAALLAQLMHVQLEAGGASDEADFDPEPPAVLEWQVGDEGALALALQPAATTPYDLPDVFDDVGTLRYLRDQDFAEETPDRERRRIKGRSLSYRWNPATQQLRRVRGSGRPWLLVVPPTERLALVEKAHKTLGHCAYRRLYSALIQEYWWHDLGSMVKDVCSSCQACQQANAAFTAKNPELNSLPLVPGFYRVHIDLAGPFEESNSGNTYTMILVDSFTKWPVLEAIPRKEPRYCMAVFRDRWVTVYGAPVVVVTDNGTEWMAEFADYLRESGIEVRKTTPGNPQANGMAERMVGGCKGSLKRYVASLDDVKEWDSKLQFIAMSYRFTKQGSLKMSPYRLVFGRDPALPFRTREVFDEPVNQECPAALVKALVRKVAALERMTPIAMANMEAAQRRDQEHYRTTRSGAYAKHVKWFQPGELVYISRAVTEGATFQTKAAPGVYRVVQIRASGVLVLQGRCGGTFKENGQHCGPCLATHMDGSVDHDLARARYESMPAGELACQLCDGQQSSADKDRPGDTMLICSHCFTGWHQQCVALEQLPPAEAAWYCPYCVQFQGKANALYAARAMAMGQAVCAVSLKELLDEYLPGEWPAATVTRLANCLPGGSRFLQASGRPECVATLPEEYEALIQDINWTDIDVVVDPFAGTGTTRRVLQQRLQKPVVLADIWPWSAEVEVSNALDPISMRSLVSTLVPGRFVYVTSPWYVFNDLALAIMMSCGPGAVFAHVPPWYITDAHDRRRSLLRKYDVHVICLDPAGNLGRRCCWLCLFPKGKKELYIKDDPLWGTISWPA